MKISIRTSRRIEDARNILVRGTNWIGDVIMTLPAMAAIRRAFPGARISVLAKPWVADIFSLCSDVDEVILYRSPGVHAGVGGILRLAGELREKKFDAAIPFRTRSRRRSSRFWRGSPCGPDTIRTAGAPC